MASREDSFPIQAIDYVQFFVGNARQAAHFYRSMGFRPVAYMGLETARVIAFPGAYSRAKCVSSSPVRSDPKVPSPST